MERDIIRAYRERRTQRLKAREDERITRQGHEIEVLRNRNGQFSSGGGANFSNKGVVKVARPNKLGANAFSLAKKIPDNVLEVVKGYQNSNKEDGTYDLFTGEQKALSKGYMVTFHQNMSEKDRYGYYNSNDYAEQARNFAMEEGCEGVYCGNFGNPEISYCFETKEQALNLAKKYNQKSIWDNEKGRTHENYDWIPEKNWCERD